jgi:hypothetical protein
MRRVFPSALLVVTLSFLGCAQPLPVDPPDVHPEDAGQAGPRDAGSEGPTDASTGVEWDGGYVELEEEGNWPEDPGRLAPCRILNTTGGNCDSSSFDLSACDTASLANAATEGVHILTQRQESASRPLDGFFMFVEMLSLQGDGGTPYIGSRPATEERVGKARVFSVTTQSYSDGGTRREVLAQCQAPEAPAFTGCYASCRNGRVSGQATFRSDRAVWRAGERESSGLELVSESFVDLGVPADVYVTQGHAYVVSLSHAPRLGGLTVFDVSNRAAPVKVKAIQFDGDNYWNGVWSKGNALYVASANNGVLVFDITEPANPRLVTSLPGRAANNHTVFVDGHRLYATLDTAVVIFDISTPTRPVEIGRYSSEDGFSYPHDMFAVGDRLYVNYADVGYVVVDVSDPADPRALGNYSYINQYSHANAVGTFAGRTLAFVGGEDIGEHLRVLDITDPAHMVKIGRFQLRPAISIHNMLLVGRKLYVAWYQEGVRVLDVSNPTQPTQSAYFNTFRETDPNRGGYFEGAIGIRVPGDGFLYTVDTSRGLLILREK